MAASDETLGSASQRAFPFRSFANSNVYFSLPSQRFRDDNNIQSAMLRASDAGTDRNRIVHSWWFTDIPDGAPSRLKPKAKGASYDSADIDADALAASISQSADDFGHS